MPSIVDTRIRHQRQTPIQHGFDYRSTSWLVDVDHLPQPRKLLRPFAEFRPADHFPEPPHSGQTLRARLTAHLAGAGIDLPADTRIVALTSPRVAGYVFNPLSVFWCHRADGTVGPVIAEVHNTYGERHVYVVEPDDQGNAQVPKEFYVSPFNDVSGDYHLHVPPPTPDGRVQVSITLQRNGHQPFVATLTGQTRPASTRAVIATQLRTPLAPLVVSARIRWQGIRLWHSRLPIVDRPQHRVTTTIDDARRTPIDQETP
ncbi:DUF1365 domain-containing protein [Gordonia sp. CPCC 205515]|uniref:DUF1365 domain-containing protein n=1 Tax=Gordonia sp. CPCC 205515 TaxID=3140791 RepID=UPI003AF36DFA